MGSIVASSYKQNSVVMDCVIKGLYCIWRRVGEIIDGWIL